MTDEPNNEPTETADDEPAALQCGERLAAARREKQITVLEIAKELHIDEGKVRSLERNEFEELGAPVFAKGHLRKYAQLVDVDEADVFSDYYQLTRSQELPPIIVGRRKVDRGVSPGPWVAVIVVILVAAISYWWFVVEAGSLPFSDSGADAATGAVVAPAPVDAATDQTPRPADLPSAPVEDATPAPATQAESAPVVAESVDDGQTRLTLTFSGNCWTEISDATGRRLYFNMGREGSTIELSGVAPFAVLLGNIENVSLQVDGSPYAVTAAEVGGRTARFTLENP